MSQKAVLIEFVQQALAAGRSREDISAAMKDAGWSDGEMQAALDAFAQTEFSPPVPRPRNVVSARDFFVYSVTFAMLGVMAVNLVLLLHLLIETFWDAELSNTYQHRRARNFMAAVIVATPIYLWLTVRERRKLAREPGQYRSAIRKWTTYIALFAAAIVFLVNAIVTVAGFLNGDLTVVFSLKLLVVAVVSGGIFWFYLPDAEGPK